jgi:hypothetical protein
MLIDMEGGGGIVVFEWNPKSINITKKTKWLQLKAAGREQAILEYGCGDPRELTFDLELSRSDMGIGYVQAVAEAVFQMSRPTVMGQGVDRPPKVHFILGLAVDFIGVIESVKSQYGPLFDPYTLLPYEGHLTIHVLEVGM